MRISREAHDILGESLERSRLCHERAWKWLFDPILGFKKNKGRKWNSNGWPLQTLEDYRRRREREQSKSVFRLGMSSPAFFFGGLAFGLRQQRQVDNGKKKTLQGRSKRGKPLIGTSGATFTFPTVREWPARVSTKSPSQWLSHKLTNCKSNTFLSIEGSIYSQICSTSGSLFIKQILLLGIFNSNPSTEFRYWHQRVQNYKHSCKSKVQIYRLI